MDIRNFFSKRPDKSKKDCSKADKSGSTTMVKTRRPSSDQDEQQPKKKQKMQSDDKNGAHSPIVKDVKSNGKGKETKSSGNGVKSREAKEHAKSPTKVKVKSPEKAKAKTPEKNKVKTPEKTKSRENGRDHKSTEKVKEEEKIPEYDSRPITPPPPPSLLWVEKYKPTNLKSIIGQQGDKSNMRKLVTWLQNWTKHHGTPGAKAPPRPPPWQSAGDTGVWAKAALLSGPPGVGKTTTAYLVSRELGYDIMEMNASDSRSKKLLEQQVTDAMSSHSVSKVSNKRIILMDEVDGMAGNEDRGGMAELIQLIKKSRIPVICMCNDRNHQKIRSLANYCFDLRFQRPRAEQIKAAMMSVCFKEKVKISPEALMELITACNQDIRQVMHHLSLMKARSSDEKLEAGEAKKEGDTMKKTSIKIGPFDVVRKVFSASEHKNMSLFDKSDLFFQDYSFGPLFTQENYLYVQPAAAKNKRDTMELVSKAADSFCQGDLVNATIRSRNAWNLLPTQAMYSSVIPGEYMSGYLQGQIQFPSWLGKFSKKNKFDRITQELQMHTRLSAGVSKSSLNMDLSQALLGAIVRPMKNNGNDGVSQSVEVMKTYSLLREDLDNLIEFCQWPDQEHPLKGIDSKVKAAFTRLYNKEVVLPYATNAAVAGKKRANVQAEDLLNEEEEEEEEENNDDISADAMIKAKKPSKSKETKDSKTESKGKGGGRGGKRSKK